MSNKASKHPCLVRASERGLEESMQHPLNPRSEVHGHVLGQATGLRRIGVNIIRVPPGKESFIHHSHEGEEEFLYILSGRGIAELGDEAIEVGPGDFMGFPAPSIGHHLRNPFAEELVYLCGGERHDQEIAHYPKLGKTLVRVGERMSLFDDAHAQAFAGAPKVR